MAYTTIAVIYNPISTGPSKDLATAFVERLKARLPKQKVELIATEYAKHAEKFAYEIAKASENPLVISSSGDGGYNEVVNGALRAQNEGFKVTTGLLPSGNANDHYHNLHTTDIIKQIIDGKARKIDVLKLTGTVDGKPLERYAHSYIGIGLTPLAGKELNKVKLNLFNEVMAVMRVLIVNRSVKLKIGKKFKHYDSVIFSNVDKMSKYLKISQPSSISDGKFEVTIFTRSSKIQLISTLLQAATVGAQEDHSVSEFSLETAKETLVQLDGEIVTLDAQSQMAVSSDKQTLECVV